MTVSIPVVLSTIREGRKTEQIAHHIVHALERKEVQTQLVDLRELQMSNVDDGPVLAASNPNFSQAMSRADGFVFVSPEYNHSIPGPLKRALDMLKDEWRQKAVGFVGVSSGPFGGVRASEAFASIARSLYLFSIRNDLYVPNVNQFTPDESFSKLTDNFLTELIWLTEALQAKRNS